MTQDAIALGKAREAVPEPLHDRSVTEVRQTVRALVAGDVSAEENLTLARHVHKHQDALLAFLDDAMIPPTNNRAEGEGRGAVVLRKAGGCRRSETHARAHAVLASHAQTAWRRGRRLDTHVTRWMALHAPAGPLNVGPCFAPLTRCPAPRPTCSRGAAPSTDSARTSWEESTW
jgi:hypothetical protein